VTGVHSDPASFLAPLPLGAPLPPLLFPLLVVGRKSQVEMRKRMRRERRKTRKKRKMKRRKWKRKLKRKSLVVLHHQAKPEMEVIAMVIITIIHQVGLVIKLNTINTGAVMSISILVTMEVVQILIELLSPLLKAKIKNLLKLKVRDQRP